MKITNLGDIFYIPKENLSSVNNIYITYCCKCLSAQKIICFCENNDKYFDYICNNVYNCIFLTLNNISLKTFSKNIVNLKNMEILVLANNKIKYIPNELFLLKNLINLNLQNNLIEHIPEFIYNLKNLETLNFSYNKIKYLDKKIKNLSNLKKLILNGNLIKDFPDEIADLQNVSKLFLDASQNVFVNNDKMLIHIFNNNIVIPENIIHLNIIFSNNNTILDKLPYSIEYLTLGYILSKITNLPFNLKKIKINKNDTPLYKNLKLPFGCVMEYY